jgi:tetratricopeptide (TPR) repeat protein
MKLLAWMLVLFISPWVYSQETASEITSASKNVLFKEAVRLFSEGKYLTTALELKNIEQNLDTSAGKDIRGLIAYWSGICFNRLQDFPQSIFHFDKSLGLNYAPQDIHYEYGQALFAAEKLSQARLQFRESLKRKFKRAVSLYYIAYISKEMGERKKAFTFFRSIDKLDDDEAKEVKQAAEMQIADIYLEQTEKRSDAFKTVEDYVIPQYQKAYDLDKDSSLALIIQDKIVKLQRKYDLILFQLRNGRPTLNPPYLVRFAQEFGQDSNVTFSPAGTTISKAKQASGYSRSDFVGRYTFYHKDFFSIAPEFRFNRTYYFNRVPEIYRNDNYLMAPAVRTAYEHTLWKKPASFLLDYDYNEARRDVEAKKELKFSSRSHTIMVGERFNFFSGGESIVRLRQRMLESYLPSSDSTLTSLVFEQIRSINTSTLLFYLSYDRMKVKDSRFDTNGFTFRTDLILGRVRDWFTPSFGLMLTSTDPINDREARGRELLFNPSARLSKTFKQHWRGNLKFDYQNNKSKDEANFAYKKTIYAFELEYLF